MDFSSRTVEKSGKSPFSFFLFLPLSLYLFFPFSHSLFVFLFFPLFPLISFLIPPNSHFLHVCSSLIFPSHFLSFLLLIFSSLSFSLLFLISPPSSFSYLYRSSGGNFSPLSSLATCHHHVFLPYFLYFIFPFYYIM